MWVHTERERGFVLALLSSFVGTSVRTYRGSGRIPSICVCLSVSIVEKRLGPPISVCPADSVSLLDYSFCILSLLRVSIFYARVSTCLGRQTESFVHPSLSRLRPDRSAPAREACRPDLHLSIYLSVSLSLYLSRAIHLTVWVHVCVSRWSVGRETSKRGRTRRRLLRV